jgi:hypothetical protein
VEEQPLSIKVAEAVAVVVMVELVIDTSVFVMAKFMCRAVLVVNMAVVVAHHVKVDASQLMAMVM